MGDERSAKLWRLAELQHGVVSRRQLRELGYTSAAIHHRMDRGRLFAVHQGVYAVGRPGLTSDGRYLAAVLACGRTAELSRASAAHLWSVRPRPAGPIHVTVSVATARKRSGIRVHRRRDTPDRIRSFRRGIPVTDIATTIVDLAADLRTAQLEAAINAADRHDLITPAGLLRALDGHTGRPGVRHLRETLEGLYFVLTDSELERMFIRLCQRAQLELPQVGAWVNGWKVDFFWPELGLIVETDGLRYHRTEIQLGRDRRRDQEHAAHGYETLRFTHSQVAKEPRYVEAILRAVMTRLRHAMWDRERIVQENFVPGDEILHDP